jgi:hypothetical protein
MSFVVRLGGYYLQGVNGWGQRSCALAFEGERDARRAAKAFEDDSMPAEKRVCVEEEGRR